MFIRILFFCILLSFKLSMPLEASGGSSSSDRGKITYPLQCDPIDAVIVCHEKDKAILHYCIKGIRKNVINLRRIIVVSATQLTDEAEWFDEALFPFTKDEIALTIARGCKKRAAKFFYKAHRTPGWYYQQNLKLCSSFVIPDISSNVLVVDADTVFMRRIKFLNESCGGYFCYNTQDAPKPAYFAHAQRLVPGYKRMYPNVYSVCHHMLFQRPILEDLFRTVEEYHKKEFWKAFCLCVDLKQNKGASEFEIYYSFALSHTDQVELRSLRWTNSPNFDERKIFKKRGFHYVSFHDYLMKNPTVNVTDKTVRVKGH